MDGTGSLVAISLTNGISSLLETERLDAVWSESGALGFVTRSGRVVLARPGESTSRYPSGHFDVNAEIKSLQGLELDRAALEAQLAVCFCFTYSMGCLHFEDDFVAIEVVSEGDAPFVHGFIVFFIHVSDRNNTQGDRLRCGGPFLGKIDLKRSAYWIRRVQPIWVFDSIVFSCYFV